MAFVCSLFIPENTIRPCSVTTPLLRWFASRTPFHRAKDADWFRAFRNRIHADQLSFATLGTTTTQPGYSAEAANSSRTAVTPLMAKIVGLYPRSSWILSPGFSLHPLHSNRKRSNPTTRFGFDSIYCTRDCTLPR